MSFATPTAFLLLLLLPLVLRHHSSSKTNRFTSSSFVPLKNLPLTLRERIATPLLSALLCITFVSSVIALARPQNVSEKIEVEEEARDIMFLLDLSGSMKAMDFFIQQKRVDRLDALKSVTSSFVKQRVGDRMGLIVFGDHAFTQCPLTTDRDVLTNFVEQLDVGIAGYGTAIGDALAIAIKRLGEIESDSKVIVLVTDGKNTSGSLSTSQGAELAQKLGIKIHVAGIGGNQPAPYPIVDQLGRTRLINRVFEYDEAALREIANITGGEYHNALDIEGLQQIYSRLDELESRTDTTTHYYQYTELYEPFALVALISLLAYQFLLSTILLRVP